MCGIAGQLTESAPTVKTLKNCLSSMKERGPDNQSYKSFKFKNRYLSLLHSRLSIIDLNKRSNQPMSLNGFTIIFNGEIYNYRELKKDLENKNYKFKTSSDTEVFLVCFIHYKERAFELLEGMWAAAIWNDKEKKLYLARDKFGEKPLYYFSENGSLFFGSQIKQIEILRQKNFLINTEKVSNFLLLGYKNSFKNNKSFFKGVSQIDPGQVYVFDKEKLIKKKYWDLNYVQNPKLNFQDIINRTRELLIESVDNQTHADTSVAIMLSGGVDSATIASIAHKVLNKKITTYSIVNSDKRYSEINNINATVKDLNCANIKLDIKKLYKKNLLDELIKKVHYNYAPLLTITSFASSFLHKKISEDGHRVNLSGVGADELLSGYYDHHLFYLLSQKKNNEFNKLFYNWKKYIKPLVRNPFLNNHKYILTNKKFREHIYFTNKNIGNFFLKPKKQNFFEKNFCSDPLRQRMLNELFYETVPVILNQDDNNNMINSVENRSPFLSKKLSEFLYTVPTKYLIKNGYNKYILRESMKGICNNKILKDRKKIGFNTPFEDLFNFKTNNDLKEFILEKKSSIYDIIDRPKVIKILNKKNLLNSESKFVFSLLNCKIFMDKFS